MKKLFLAVLIFTVAIFGLMGCGKRAGTEGTSGHEGHEHPTSEHPK